MDQRETVDIAIPDGSLQGDLTLLEAPLGLVIFAHGSGSSRHSPRNRFVAGALNDGGLATLLVDLLTPREERVDALTGELRFDIGFLAARLMQVTRWARSTPATRTLSLGYFGASTGAAAALVAAARLPQEIAAIVSRGGRPDLAGDALPLVRAPTLLIVGGADTTVLELNRRAYEQLRAEANLVIVPGARHLFEEPGALEQVAALARHWFVEHFVPTQRGAPPPAP